jgi:hypothetical protein
MKLYATVSSERAAKGQGGNRIITTELLVGDKNNSKQIATITLLNRENEYLLYADIIGRDERITLYREEKGRGEEQVKVKTERTHTQGNEWHN